VVHSAQPFTDHRVDLLVTGLSVSDHCAHRGAGNEPRAEVLRRTEEETAVADLKKGARITGTQRDKLATDLKKKYEKGASIRALAEQTGRSYGFVHRVLSETGVSLRGRGGATRTKKK
jgi:Helix-turn-helix domain